MIQSYFRALNARHRGVFLIPLCEQLFRSCSGVGRRVSGPSNPGFEASKNLFPALQSQLRCTRFEDLNCQLETLAWVKRVLSIRRHQTRAPWLSSYHTTWNFQHPSWAPLTLGHFWSPEVEPTQTSHNSYIYIHHRYIYIYIYHLYITIYIYMCRYIYIFISPTHWEYIFGCRMIPPRVDHLQKVLVWKLAKGDHFLCAKGKRCSAVGTLPHEKCDDEDVSCVGLYLLWYHTLIV